MGFFTLLTLPLAYGHLIRAGMFAANWGFRLATDHPQMLERVSQLSIPASVKQEVETQFSQYEVPSPYMSPIYEQWM